jgi:tyrosyl-tRNA synthetase
MFGESMRGLHAPELLAVFANVPSADLAREEVENRAVVDVVVAAGMCSSKGAARRLIQNGGLYLNNERVTQTDATIGPDDIVDGRLIVMRSGKKNTRLIRIA